MSERPADRPERWPVTASRSLLDGSFVSARRDTLRGPDGSVFDRDVVEHHDAVGTVVLDDDLRVLLLGQYRHPVGHRLLELPAGLLDEPGEDPAQAAARELFEEAALRAADWRVLVDSFASPGVSTERWRVYLARDLTVVPESERHRGAHEEADLDLHWLPLDDAVQAVLDGRIENPMAVMGVLATWAAQRGAGLRALRPSHAPWPARAADVEPGG